MSKIIYNGFLVGSGMPDPLVTSTPTPFFRGDGRRLGIAQNYNLIGQITGCHFDDIISGMTRLNNIFSKDFGTLQFLDDDSFSIINSGTKINSISYTQSTEIGVQDYTISLTCYPQSFFESAGVIDKKNEFSISQEFDGNLTLTHTIFAQGKNTAPTFSNAFDNAKNFVLQYTGLSLPTLFPFFVTGFSGASIDSRTETVNRLDASYQISETYIGRTGSNVSSSFSVDLTSGSDGIIITSIGGEFRAGKGQNISLAMSAYNAFNPYNQAVLVYNHYRGATGLQPTPLSSGLTQNFGENSVQFNVEFTDWPQVSYRNIYNVSIESGVEGIITASINGTVEGIGRLPDKYDRAFQFFKTFNIFNAINDEYLTFVGPSYPYSLVTIPTNSGVEDNRFAGTISYNTTLDNRTIPIPCSGIKFFDIEIIKNYPIQAISPISIPHSISGIDSVDLGYKSRGSITIQGRIQVQPPSTYLQATGLAAQYVNGRFRQEHLNNALTPFFPKTELFLESVNFDSSVIDNSTSFTVTYSFNEPLQYSPSAGNYNTIDSPASLTL